MLSASNSVYFCRADEAETGCRRKKPRASAAPGLSATPLISRRKNLVERHYAGGRLRCIGLRRPARRILPVDGRGRPRALAFIVFRRSRIYYSVACRRKQKAEVALLQPMKSAAGLPLAGEQIRMNHLEAQGQSLHCVHAKSPTNMVPAQPQDLDRAEPVSIWIRVLNWLSYTDNYTFRRAVTISPLKAAFSDYFAKNDVH